MTPATLYALHERLTSDTAQPFESDGNAHSVRSTAAGQAWLSDWHDYRRTWEQLHNAGQNPDALLKARFGYVLESELPPEDGPARRDNGRRRQHHDEEGPEIVWYNDTLREPYVESDIRPEDE